MRSIALVVALIGLAAQAGEADLLALEKLNAEENADIKFEQVAVVGKDGETVIGTPVVEGASVSAKVLKNGKSKKVTVFTYRAKKGSKRKMGHRQPYTKVQIMTINA